MERLGAEIDHMEQQSAAGDGSGAGGGVSTARLREMNHQLHTLADVLKVKKQGVLRGKFDTLFGRLERLRVNAAGGGSSMTAGAGAGTEDGARASSGSIFAGLGAGDDNDGDDAGSSVTSDSGRDEDGDAFSDGESYDESITDSITTAGTNATGARGVGVSGQMLGGGSMMSEHSYA